MPIKSKIKAQIKFDLTEDQSKLVQPLIDKTLTNKFGGMVVGCLIQHNDESIEASYKWVDWDTSQKIIEFVNSRKQEIENA